MVDTGGRALFDKMKNRRFRRTEEAIFKIFAEGDDDLTVEKLVEKVDISTSTFYRHHHSIGEILIDYEQLILRRFTQNLSENFQGMSIKFTIYCGLIFLMNNRDIIKVIAERDNYLIIYQMVIASKSVFAGISSMTIDKIFNIYACEVCGIIMDWQKCDYEEQKLNEVSRDIIFLTETIKERLGPLIN